MYRKIVTRHMHYIQQYVVFKIKTCTHIYQMYRLLDVGSLNLPVFEKEQVQVQVFAKISIVHIEVYMHLPFPWQYALLSPSESMKTGQHRSR